MGQKALGRVLVASTLWGWFGGTHGCWGSLRLDEDQDLLGRALGCIFGCWDSTWGRRVLDALGCWGSLWVGRLWGATLGGCWVAPLGTKDSLGVGGHWAPLGAGGTHGWVGSGISLGGRWAAPLGAGTHVGWVGIGFLWCWVPLGWRTCGCTLGCQGPHGVGTEHWVPSDTRGPYGVGGGTHGCWGSQWLDEDRDLLGRALGCTFGCRDSCGAGGRWVPSGAGGPYGSEGFGVHPWEGAGLHPWVPGWVGTGLHLWVPGTPLGWVGIGHPWVLGVPMGGWALGSPWEGAGLHLWVPGLTWSR